MTKLFRISPNPFDLKSFRIFFDEHFTQIKNFIYYKSSSIDLSEDLAQECFLKVWEHRHKIDQDTAKKYLYTVAKNLAIDHIKKQQTFFKFLSRKSDRTDQETPQFLLEEKEFDMQLQKALSDLPEKQRIVFLMNRIDDLSYNEIAERLGLSVKAVEKRMSQALNNLRACITQKI